MFCARAVGFFFCIDVGPWREKERKEPRRGRGKEEIGEQVGSMEGKGEKGAEEREGRKKVVSKLGPWNKSESLR